MQDELPDLRGRSFPRRSLLKSAAAVLTAGAAADHLTQAQTGPVAGTNRVRPVNGVTYVYVGTYTPPTSGRHGQGIHVFRMNLANGVLSPVTIVSSSVSPSWITFSPDGNNLYASNEQDTFMYQGQPTGSVSAYQVDKGNGNLILLNSKTSAGTIAANCSVDPKGKFVFVANYGGLNVGGTTRVGTIAVLPILPGGLLDDPSDVAYSNAVCMGCAVGSQPAAAAPPGSFAISGHEQSRAHMVQMDPTGTFVLAQDLGFDATLVWRLNRTTGKLTPVQALNASNGAGPRHFAFHPNGRWFYSLNEEASTVDFSMFDPSTGMLSRVQQDVSTLPPNFKGTNYTAEIVVSPDGRFIYCTNRLHNSIGIFAIEASGRVTRIGETWTRADYPRNCNLDPTGSFLYVAHDRSDNVTTFSVNRLTGDVVFTGQYVAVGAPAVTQFLVT